MKTTYYHGTSADNLPFILKHGLSVSENKIWSVSEDAVYLWEPLGCGLANDLEEEEHDLEAFKMANESGQIACAVAKDCRIVVLKIEIESDEVFDDTSCENMQVRGAKCIYRDIQISEITEIKISNDLSLLKGFFISILANNNYNNQDFTRLELMVADAFKESCIFDELNDFIEFEQLEIAF